MFSTRRWHKYPSPRRKPRISRICSLEREFIAGRNRSFSHSRRVRQKMLASWWAMCTWTCCGFRLTSDGGGFWLNYLPREGGLLQPGFFECIPESLMSKCLHKFRRQSFHHKFRSLRFPFPVLPVNVAKRWAKRCSRCFVASCSTGRLVLSISSSLRIP